MLSVFFHCLYMYVRLSIHSRSCINVSIFVYAIMFICILFNCGYVSKKCLLSHFSYVGVRIYLLVSCRILLFSVCYGMFLVLFLTYMYVSNYYLCIYWYLSMLSYSLLLFFIYMFVVICIFLHTILYI